MVKDRFRAQVAKLYSAMQKRMTRKKLPRLPFTGDELFTHMLEYFGPNGVALCRYCRRVLDYSTCEVDHAIPLKRGGGLGLDNIGYPCKTCNRIKGGLTPTEMESYLVFSRSLHPAAQADLDERLSKAVGAMAGQNWHRDQRKKGASHV